MSTKDRLKARGLNQKSPAPERFRLRECDRCGKVGPRGFWVQVRQAPDANRTLCNDFQACERRRRAAAEETSEDRVPFDPHGWAVE